MIFFRKIVIFQKKAMKYFFRLYMILGFSLTISGLLGQSVGFEMPAGKGKIDIPFEYYNNFILVKVKFNKVFTLKFIFDTGAEHTILTKREITDILAIPYGRTFQVMGSDLQKTLIAHLVKDINLETGLATAFKQDILVLDEDYFRFEEFTGTEVHGILGADLFRRFVVKINYQRRLISLYNPKYYTPPTSSKYDTYTIKVHKSKPYINGNVFAQKDTIDCNFLIDTGASMALLLNTFAHKNFELPPNTIKSNVGAGLGGFIEGYTGRVQNLRFAQYDLQNVITSFQDQEPILNRDSTFFRNGIIGNEILNRFTIILNYPLEKIYFKPNRKFKRKFVYDKSGLTLITAGQLNNTLVVQNVLPDTPAAEAGIFRGDIIKSINGIPASFLSLKNATNMLRSKAGKTIRIKLERIGYPVKRKFVLRDLI